MASIPFVSGILGVALGGIISDILIHRGWKAISARKVPLVIGALVAAVSFGSVTTVTDINLSIGLLALGYFVASMSTGVIWTLATDVAPKSMVASLGSIQNFGGFVGAALAPVVTGVVLQATEHFEYAFSVGTVLLVISPLSYGGFLKKKIGQQLI